MKSAEGDGWRRGGIPFERIRLFAYWRPESVRGRQMRAADPAPRSGRGDRRVLDGAAFEERSGGRRPVDPVGSDLSCLDDGPIDEHRDELPPAERRRGRKVFGHRDHDPPVPIEENELVAVREEGELAFRLGPFRPVRRVVDVAPSVLLPERVHAMCEARPLLVDEPVPRDIEPVPELVASGLDRGRGQRHGRDGVKDDRLGRVGADEALVYANYYEPEDHAEVAGLIGHTPSPWIVSYDDTDEVRALYQGRRSIAYGIAYSAQHRYRGREVIFFSDGLTIPTVGDPTAVRPDALDRLQPA